MEGRASRPAGRERPALHEQTGHPFLLLTARVSEARLGLTLSLCRDPPNPKTDSRQGAPRTRPKIRSRRRISPLRLAPLAITPMGTARLKKRNWTPHSSCWWNGRNTSRARPALPSLCPRVRRWFAAPAPVLQRQQSERGCRFVLD